MNDLEIANLFKAFSDENRIKILKLLGNEEKCACKLLDAMNITQPTLSHHLKILSDTGILNARKEGKWMHYKISKEGIEKIKIFLKQF